MDELQPLRKMTSTRDASTTPEEWGITNEGKSTKSFTSLNYILFILLSHLCVLFILIEIL